jgi:outer membrane protein TolC
MKRFKLFSTVLIFVFVYVTGRAQSKVLQLTAKEAVETAFANVADLKNAKLDYKIAEARNKEITGAALPQVNGTLQGNHYLSLPQIQFPDASEIGIYDVLKREGVRDGSGNPITSDGEFQLRNFSFFQPWNINAGLTVQQLLFDPQVFVGLQARRALLQSSDLQIKVAEDKVREAVYKSYYAVLIAEKQLVYVQESIKRLEKLASDQNIMYKNGFAEKLDLDKTQVTLNNIRTAESQLKNGIRLGYAALKMTLGLHQSDSLVLKDSLSPALVKDDLLNEGFSYENRNEVKLLNKAHELQGYDIRRWRLAYAPTLAVFYGFQRNGQRSDNPPPGVKNWFWYNTNQVGLSVNIPIFDGTIKKHRISQAQFNRQKVANTLDQVKKGIDLELTASRNSLHTAIQTLDVQEDNMELAEKVFNTVKKKYEQGLGSSFEVLQSDNEMQQAQSNYFRALYEAIVAKVNYLKAVGKL